ncbi:hypothetical protein M5E82_06380 [Parabacteroides distasonis]|nr:hypothetical protein M5E82_06380 [Parabacteroides distasonis]
MKTDFSIQRINLLLRKDWIENKKKLAYGVLVILGVLFFSCYPPFYGIRDSVPLHYMYWDHWGLLSLSVAT